MTTNNHKEFLSNLQKTATLWGIRFAGTIDAEEAYSELLVQYAEALKDFDEKKGQNFNSFFYFYRQRALKNLFDEAHKWKSVGACLLDIDKFTAVLFSDEAKAVLHNVLAQVDLVQLSTDARKLLDFLMSTDIFENKTRKRTGWTGIVALAKDKLDWNYARAKKAVDDLRIFYNEYAYAC